MGEIRSTLDIIMEKTKGLAPTEEEKAAFRREVLAKKANGLVQKYMDGLTDLRGVASVVAGADPDEREDMEVVLKEAAIHRLDPEEGRYERLIELLDQVLKVDRAPFMALVAQFQKAVSEEKTARLEAFKRKLAERKISGSATLPNWNADPTWGAFLEDRKGRFSEAVRLISSSQTTDSG